MADSKTDNVCCPELMVVNCADTDEHKHLVCGYSKAIIANETVIKVKFTLAIECLKGG